MIVDEINKLKKTDLSKVISKRMKEFASVWDLFGELCFCILTANFNAERCIKIQNEIDFLSGGEKLAVELRRLGHRFPNTRAKYISEAKKFRKLLIDLPENGKDAREILVKNFKGIGMKEASHFLRNIGYKDVAIIDFHIIDLLKREGMISFEKALNKRKYLETEKILEELAKKVNLNLAELDLYLWYIETGKVLK